MPDRFVSTYDEAHSLSMEAIWEKYASGRQVTEILLGLEAVNALRSKGPSLNNHIIHPASSARWCSSIRRGKRRVEY